MLIVFKEGTQSTISLEKFSTMDGVLSIEPLDVSGKVNVEAPVTYVPPPPIKDESSGSSSNVALIAGVVGGVGGALLVAIAVAVVYMRKGREPEPIQAIQTINVDNLKAQLSQDV